MTRTLIVSAWNPEIAPLRRMLRPAPRRWAAAAVGIGPVDAAVGAARAIARFRPARVIFVGTAGAYPRGRVGVEIGAAAVAGELIAVATAVLRGEAYLPAPQATRSSPSRRLSAELAGSGGDTGRSSIVACPAAITRSAALARRIAAATGASLENLEAFAVARAAAAARVEFAAVLGVSNRVGPTGHEEWRVNHAAASRAACAVLARYLAQPRG
jgi:nucleoside phosphorylase